MAEEKKDKPKGIAMNGIEMVIIGVFLLAVLATIVPMILDFSFFSKITFFGFGFSSVKDFFVNNSFVFKLVGFSVAAVAAVFGLILSRAAEAVSLAEKAKLFPNTNTVEEVSQNAISTNNDTLNKWNKIVELSESDSESNWRLSIIEADIMLDELLQNLHLPGDTMGEKLKAVEKSDFVTIDNAWEAHKIRNMIAHEGSNFLLNQREVRRVIALYGSVFKEFSII